MDESELSRHLKTISERPIPNLPSILGSVSAKIRRAEAAVRENWLDRLVSTLLRPQWAIAVFTITLLVGGNLGPGLANSGTVLYIGPSDLKSFRLTRLRCLRPSWANVDE